MAKTETDKTPDPAPEADPVRTMMATTGCGYPEAVARIAAEKAAQEAPKSTE